MGAGLLVHLFAFLAVLTFALFKGYSENLSGKALLEVRITGQWEVEEGRSVSLVRVERSSLRELEGRNGVLFLWGSPPKGERFRLEGEVKLKGGKLFLYAHRSKLKRLPPPRDLRSKLLRRLREELENEELRAMAEAFLLGESRRNLPLSLEGTFLKTGLVHLLVVSGLHVGLLYGFFSFFLPPRLGASAGALAVLFYGLFLVPPNPPALRATLMLLGYALSLLSYRRYCSLCSLFFSGTFLLLLFPHFSLSYSFWLSFFAVLYILLTLRGVELSGFKGAFLASLSAFTGVSPLVGSFSFVSPASILLTPLLTPLLLAYAFFSMLSLVSFFYLKPALWLSEALGLLMIKVLSLVEPYAPTLLLKLESWEGFALSSLGAFGLLLAKTLKGRLAVLLLLNLYLLLRSL